MRAALACGIAAAFGAGVAHATPPSASEIATLCANADGPTHCARLVEEVQLKRLPALAIRDSATLRIALYPSGSATFTDTEAPTGGRSYSLWDFVNELNAVVLFTTDGDDSSFTLLLRANGRRYELPAEPKVSPDRQRVVTADFCASRCANELAVWRASRDSLRKELAWRPTEAWSDAVATWKDADTIVVEYTRAADGTPRTLERPLGAIGWSRVAPP